MSTGSVNEAGLDTSQKLQYIAEAIAQPPISQVATIIELHDEWSFFQLLNLLNDVLIQIDVAQSPSGATKHKVDLRDETAEATTQRICEAISLLKYKAD